MDWSKHYPLYYPTKDAKSDKKVEFADIGCGYGGLLIALAPLFPETLMIGMVNISKLAVTAPRSLLLMFTRVQVWRFDSRLKNTFMNVLRHFELSILDSIRMYPLCA
jgi:16S rRNA G1207 methylase RsmC